MLQVPSSTGSVNLAWLGNHWYASLAGSRAFNWINYDELALTKEFLDSNRSWKQAAETLFVHKQTLIYRMRRVEELTGQRLNNTSDVVHLWLALRAYEIID